MPLGTFLNGGTAVQLRGLAWLSLSDSGQRGTSAFVSDGGGGGTTTWAYGGTVPCRVDPIGGDEGIVANRIHDQSTHVITTPAGTELTHNDRFRVTNRGTFEITAVRKRTAEWARFLEAIEVS